MKVLPYLENIPFSINSNYSYRDVTSDGKFLYFLLPYQPLIAQYDLSFQKTGVLRSARTYRCICFDAAHSCFWACSSELDGTIYQLDSAWHEVNHMVIPDFSRTEWITSISKMEHTDQLLLSTMHTLYTFDMESQRLSSVKETDHLSIINSLATGFGYLVVTFTDGVQYLHCFDTNGQILGEFPFSTEYVVKRIHLFSWDASTNTITLSVLAAKPGGSSFLLKTEFQLPTLSFIGEPSQAALEETSPENREENSAFSESDLTPWDDAWSEAAPETNWETAPQAAASDPWNDDSWGEEPWNDDSWGEEPWNQSSQDVQWNRNNKKQYPFPQRNQRNPYWEISKDFDPWSDEENHGSWPQHTNPELLNSISQIENVLANATDPYSKEIAKAKNLSEHFPSAAELTHALEQTVALDQTVPTQGISTEENAATCSTSVDQPSPDLPQPKTEDAGTTA